ncbi:Beta,beta-carotene 15,15'-dioxygenase [Armadillidium vulgare]|nr:Beta,beta-carotene 15,15'-dioxygenase [Armadillidium vulgare]
MELMANTLKNTPFIEGLHWKNEKTLFHIFSRSSWKKVSTKYVSDPFFFIHFSNAFEKEDHIIVDVNTYKDASLLTNSYITKLREATSNSSASFHEGFCPILKRFIIPLKVESMKENEELVQLQNTECSAKKTGNEIHLIPEVLSNLPFENPASNAKYSVHGNRFVWGMGPSPYRENYNQIIKIDLETKETVLFKEEGSHTSPPIFVPSSNAEKEDDGVILSLLLTSEKENLVTLLILDAANAYRNRKSYCSNSHCFFNASSRKFLFLFK